MELCDLFALYSDFPPLGYEIKDTSHGAEDFRQAIFCTWQDKKTVIKITCNDFTTEDKVRAWKKTADAYIEAGYYCPRFLPDGQGRICNTVDYSGKRCVVYAEEYSKYKTAEEFDEGAYMKDGRYIFHDDAIRSIGVIASKHLRTTDTPSGYCIFETFSPSDPCDEELETAEQFRDIVYKDLPGYRERFDRIWKLYMDNRLKLESVYRDLPTSVFQADLHISNILLSDTMDFVGLLDFNLCGRDTLLNYLFREAMGDFDEDVPYEGDEKPFYSEESSQKAVDSLLHNISVVKEVYTFSEIEKANAVLVYRYLRPFWWPINSELRNIQQDDAKLNALFNWIEHELTREDIDFIGAMS